MSAGLYVNDGGVTRKLKKLYTNVGGVTRELKELWVNDAGVARKIFSGLEAKLTSSINVTSDSGAWYIKSVKHDANGLDLTVCAQAKYLNYDGDRSNFYFTGSDGRVYMRFDLSEVALCVQRNVKLNLDAPINFAAAGSVNAVPRDIRVDITFRSTAEYWTPLLRTQKYSGNTLNPPSLALTAPDGYSSDAEVYYFNLYIDFGYNDINIGLGGDVKTCEVGFHVIIPSGAFSVLTGPEGLDEFPLNFT